jgi:hypothetical protein
MTAVVSQWRILSLTIIDGNEECQQYWQRDACQDLFQNS